MSKDLREGIKHSLKTKGIAYSYTSSGREAERVLLNPDWICLHSEPMCLIDVNGDIVAIKGQPLVFKNRLVAEGALMTLQLINPEKTISLIIDEYSKDKKQVELEMGAK